MRFEVGHCDGTDARVRKGQGQSVGASVVRGCEVCAVCNGNGSFEIEPSATVNASDWLTRMVTDLGAFATAELVQVTEIEPNILRGREQTQSLYQL